MKMKMLATLAVAATAGFSACGGSESDGGASGSASSGKSIDRAFVAAMVPHHESAVEMAEIAQERGSSRFVRNLAEDIIRTQNAEIKTMKAEDAKLADEGVQVGDLGVPDHMMGMDEDTASLETAEPFDPAFLNMMVPHHEGAVQMAEVEVQKGTDPELKQLAEAIISSQKREIAEMKAQLGDDSDDSAHHSG